MAATSTSQKMTSSNAHAHLRDEQRKRHAQKSAIIGMQDLYNIPENLFIPIRKCTLKDLPRVSDIDIYEYVVVRVNFFTGKELKAFKSLEADKYFSSGWMKDIHAWNVPQEPYFLMKA